SWRWSRRRHPRREPAASPPWPSRQRRSVMERSRGRRAGCSSGAREHRQVRPVLSRLLQRLLEVFGVPRLTGRDRQQRIAFAAGEIAGLQSLPQPLESLLIVAPADVEPRLQHLELLVPLVEALGSVEGFLRLVLLPLIQEQTRAG